MELFISHASKNVKQNHRGYHGDLLFAIAHLQSQQSYLLVNHIRRFRITLQSCLQSNHTDYYMCNCLP